MFYYIYSIKIWFKRRHSKNLASESKLFVKIDINYPMQRCQKWQICVLFFLNIIYIIRIILKHLFVQNHEIFRKIYVKSCLYYCCCLWYNITIPLYTKKVLLVRKCRRAKWESPNNFCRDFESSSNTSRLYKVLLKIRVCLNS